MPFDSTNFIGATTPTLNIKANAPTMEATTLERLDYMIGLMDRLEPERFEMAYLCSHGRANAGSEKLHTLEKPGCGTAACLLGWETYIWSEGARLNSSSIGPLGLWKAELHPSSFLSGGVYSSFWKGATPQQCASMLRHYRDTTTWERGEPVVQGIVDWFRATGRIVEEHILAYRP